jgi:hypothetical protein
MYLSKSNLALRQGARSASSNVEVLSAQSLEHSTWLSMLPLELQIMIMSQLDRDDLESLIETLDVDLYGVCQYVVDNPRTVVRERPHQLRTVCIEELDDRQNRRMINIVDIVSIKDLDIDATIRRLSKSINIITVSNFDEYPNGFLDKDSVYRGKLEALIESVNYSKSRIVIEDARNVVLRNMDLRRCIVSTKKVLRLYLDQCDIDANLMGSQGAKYIMLKGISDDYLEAIDLTGEASASIVISGLELALTNKLIRVNSLSVSGLTRVEKVTFEGNALDLIFDLRDHGQLSDLIAPYMSQLVLSLTSTPILTIRNLFAPNLKDVSIWGDMRRRGNKITDYAFLENVEQLSLYLLFEPLYDAKLCCLKTLEFSIFDKDKKLKDVVNDLPELRTLKMTIGGNIKRLPVFVSADSLETISIRYLRKPEDLEVAKISPIFRYPKLRSFSFKASTSLSPLIVHGVFSLRIVGVVRELAISETRGRNVHIECNME